MNKTLRNLLEITSFPLSYKGRRFFYGVEKREEALSYFKKGEIPVYSGKKGYAGRNYISDSVVTSCEYAGCVLGAKYSKKVLQSGRYGYIFVVSSGRLKDIYPNESDVGRFVQKIYDYQYSKDTSISKDYFKFLTWVWEILDRKEQKSIINDDGDSYFTIGKKILENMREDSILWFLDNVASRITNIGNVEFDSVYKVDRFFTSSMDEGGRDFFEKALLVTSIEDMA
jgi:hypothetical protein